MSEKQLTAAIDPSPAWRERVKEFLTLLFSFVIKDFCRVGVPVLIGLEVFFFHRGINLFQSMLCYAPFMAFYVCSVTFLFRKSVHFYEEEIKEFIVITSYSFCTILGLCIALYKMGKIDAEGKPNGWISEHILDFILDDANLFLNIKISGCIFIAVLAAQAICVISFRLFGINEMRDHRIRKYLWFGLYWERDLIPDEANDVRTLQGMANIYAPIIERSQFGIDASKFFSTLIFKCFCAAIASMSAFLLFIAIFFPNHLPEEHSSRIFIFLWICVISISFIAFYYVQTIISDIINNIISLLSCKFISKKNGSTPGR